MKCPEIIIILILSYAVNILDLSTQTYFENIFISVPSAVSKAALDKYSYNHNPSIISTLDYSLISFKFIPSRFGMNELSPSSISFAQPLLNDIAAGINLSGISNQLYNEIAGSISSGIELSKFLKFGINIELLHISVKNYSSQYALRADAGGLLDLSDAISAGFVIKNITKDYYKGADKTALMNAIFGIGFKLLDNLYFDIDASIVFNHNSGIALAGLYEIEDILYLRTAALTNPRSIEFGTKVEILDYLSISGLVNYHDMLGFSFQGCLYYTF